eukprot:c35334_g1_i1 orf=1-234(+)
MQCQIQDQQAIIRYLGLPIGLKLNLRQAWEWMWLRIEEIIGAWEGKEVDFTMRVVILNQVLMAKINFYLTLYPPMEQ